MSAKPIRFRGAVLRFDPPAYLSWITPIVALKKLLQLLYRLIVSLFWSELIEGKTANQSFTFIVFILFCLLSLLVYYGKAVVGGFAVLSGGLWLIDSQIAKCQFLQAQSNSITLEQHHDWLIWQNQAQPQTHAKFAVQEVAQVSVIRASVRGGAFRDVVGTVWQVHLTLHNRSEFLMHESRDPIAAFQQAAHLQTQLAVPLKIIGSEGEQTWASEPIQLQGLLQRTQQYTTIHCHKSEQRWHIYSEWRWSNMGRLLKQVISKVGFLLFALLVANLMLLFGGLLHILMFAGLNPSVVMQAHLFRLPLLGSVLQLFLVTGLLLWQGAKLSREEHLYITPETLTFVLDTRQIDQIPTQDIKAVFFLKQPFPALLIVGTDRVIEIRELQHETEFRILLTHLNQAVCYFHQTLNC